jgi:hypothetical protein
VPKIFYRFFLLYLSVVVLLGCSSKSPTPSKAHTGAVILPDTQASLPPFLRAAYPGPGSRVAQTAYMTETKSEETQLFYRKLAAICVDVEQRNLLEQSDHDLGGNHHSIRSYLNVSTFGPDSYSIPWCNNCKWASMAGGTLKDERGNEIDGILILCWEVDLAPGVYEATYEYTQTSGRILSYTWSFEITE